MQKQQQEGEQGSSARSTTQDTVKWGSFAWQAKSSLGWKNPYDEFMEGKFIKDYQEERHSLWYLRLKTNGKGDNALVSQP